MPARGDINPADIPGLLSYLLIVERDGDQFRNRLVGAALVRALGQEPTGKVIGASLPDPRSAAEARAIFQRVFRSGHPVFATGEFVFESGAKHTMSLLALPLSNDGKEVNMAISSLVGHFHLYEPRRGWLKDVPVKVCDIIEVTNAGHLEALALEWEQRCSPVPADEVQDMPELGIQGLGQANRQQEEGVSRDKGR